MEQVAYSMETNKLWDDVWNFLINHHVFHSLIVGVLMYLVLSPKKYKKISLGKQGLELNSVDEAIDPNTPCPYTASKETTQKTIQRIEEAIKQIIENIETVQNTLNKNESTVNRITKRLFKVSQGTLENMLFDEKQTAFKRLKAFRRLLAMGVNGDIKKEGINLVLANKEVNKEIWKIVLNTKLGIKIKDQKYYEESLAEINRLVFDYKKY